MMIVVAIIGILATIAIPAYQRYVLESRRADGVSILLELQSRQERWRVNNATYATTAQLGALPPSDFYTFAASNATGTTYTLTATAQGAQTADTGCTSLTINQAGTKTPAACWKR